MNQENLKELNVGEILQADEIERQRQNAQKK